MVAAATEGSITLVISDAWVLKDSGVMITFIHMGQGRERYCGAGVQDAEGEAACDQVRLP